MKTYFFFVFKGLNPAAKPDPRPRATPKKQGEECGVENSCAGAANNVSNAFLQKIVTP